MLTHKRFFLHIILKYFVCTALFVTYTNPITEGVVQTFSTQNLQVSQIFRTFALVISPRWG